MTTTASAIPVPTGGAQDQDFADPRTRTSGGAATRGAAKKYLQMYNDPSFVPPPTLVLESADAKHNKSLDLFERVKIGRITSAKTVAAPDNGFFDSKVLSRTHAEVWTENGAVYIRDLGSSNGTFVNGQRLSEENQPSEPRILKSGDVIEFGVDIFNEQGSEVLFKKVTCHVTVGTAKDGDAAMRRQPSQDSFTTMLPNKGGTSGKRLSSSLGQSAAKANEAASKEIQGLIAPLQNQLAKSKSVNKELNALKKDFSAIQSQIQNMDPRDIEEAKRKLLQAEQDRLQALEQVALLQGQLADTADQLQRSSQQQQELQRQVDQQAAEVARLKAAKPSAAAASGGNDTEQVALLTSEKQALAKRVEELLKTVANLKQELAQANSATKKAKAPPPKKGLPWGLIFFFLLTASSAYYLFALDGLAKVDQLSRANLGVSTNELIKAAQSQVHSIVGSSAGGAVKSAAPQAHEATKPVTTATVVKAAKTTAAPQPPKADL